MKNSDLKLISQYFETKDEKENANTFKLSDQLKEIEQDFIMKQEEH